MLLIADKLRALKVAIYIRVSTHYQIDKDSLQVQRRELIAYAQMVLGIQDYVIFEDPGYSAKNTDRPDYQKMMDRLRTGEFSHLLVWKIARISRNLLDFANMYQELKNLGVTFVSKNEQFDTSSAIGEAMLKIILIFAELERNITSERVTAVMLSRAENGQWNGGRIPYGYDFDKKEKVFSLNPIENKIYNLILDLYEQYQSVLYVTRYLNDQGFRTRSGKEWTTTAVYKILTNVFYTGDYLYNVHKGGKGTDKRSDAEWVRIEAHHVASVSYERFDRIQFILKRNKRGGVPEGETYIKKNIHVFGGLISCGKCGSNMSATLDRRRADGWRPSIYGCSKRRHNDTKCRNKYISDIILGPFVFNYIANIIRSKESVNAKTGLDTLEKKLLRGSVFYDVESIGAEGLGQLLDLMQAGSTGIEYRPPRVLEKSAAPISEREVLQTRKRKHEIALNRLKTLYLYGDSEMAEKDFIVEQKRIMDQINEIDEALRSMKDEDDGPLADDEFIEKASYFIMVQKLLDDRTVDYKKYIRRIDPMVPRAFLRSVISKITVEDDRLTSPETPVFQAFPGFLSVLSALYTINIASPKEKNRYFSRTAS